MAACFSASTESIGVPTAHSPAKKDVPRFGHMTRYGYDHAASARGSSAICPYRSEKPSPQQPEAVAALVERAACPQRVRRRSSGQQP
jgi:hypothetical protein